MSIKVFPNKDSFEFFLKSVLMQIAAVEGKRILFDAKIEDGNKSISKPGKQRYDAIAEDGLLGYSETVVFDFKYKTKENLEEGYKGLISHTNSMYKRLWMEDSNVKLIVITNAKIENRINAELSIGNLNFELWDKETLKELTNQYPLDYSNAINKNEKYLKSDEYKIPVTASAFLEKNYNNIKVIESVIASEARFALVLGAGVSIDSGAKSWDDLLQFFVDDLYKKGVIRDVKGLSEKIGDTNLITAQLCKESQIREIDFFWQIHEGLYKDGKQYSQEAELYHISRIIERCNSKRHFKVLTYNYDEYLENYLDRLKIMYNVQYDAESNIDNNLSIYHVHGFMPKVTAKSNISSRVQKSIYLTEEDYNTLYNDPYSWQIAAQLNVFREHTCLFIGCGLKDPNIRRLLEITRNENKPHYAILTKDQLNLVDLVHATNHFSRIGIEVIWVEDFNELNCTLKSLYTQIS